MADISIQELLLRDLAARLQSARDDFAGVMSSVRAQAAPLADSPGNDSYGQQIGYPSQAGDLFSAGDSLSEGLGGSGGIAPAVSDAAQLVHSREVQSATNIGSAEQR